MSIPDAARKSGISKARWSQVETGHETRAGVDRVVQAKAGTLARMAAAVGLPPERLEAEGQRADAAMVLREILQGQPSAPEPSPAAAIAPAELSDEADVELIRRLAPPGRLLDVIRRLTSGTEVQEVIRDLVEEYGDEVLKDVVRMVDRDGIPRSWPYKRGLMMAWLARNDAAETKPQRGTALPVPPHAENVYNSRIT
jgi:hypothetical protein